jgi:hypothetical protein
MESYDMASNTCQALVSNALSSEPDFLNHMASYGVASNMCQALPRRRRLEPPPKARRRGRDGPVAYHHPHGALAAAAVQGLTLVHLSAQRERFWWDKGY